MIAILTDPGVGGTFLTWSIYYLSGQTHYYSTNEKKLIPIIDNPLTENNAHKFDANQAMRNEKFEKTFKEILIGEKISDLNIIYMHQFNGAIKSYDQDTVDAIEKLLPYVSKIVLLTSTPNQALYNCSYSSRNNLDFEDFIDNFFITSKEIWHQLNLKDVWDKREFLALNFRPFDNLRIIENLDLNKDHYHINTIELWNRFDEGIGNLLKYLEIDLDNKKFKKWLAVYQQWKKIHKNRLFFMWYFDTIIEYILKGYSLDLTRFDLDICQEAAIQHVLIYRHNLNLKTWQLKKFTNTRQLHELLEPNSHPIKEY